jgi:hypothetical protein
MGNMVGALATAGRVDGGQDIWLPIVLIVLLSAVVARGAGKWALPLRGRGGAGYASSAAVATSTPQKDE